MIDVSVIVVNYNTGHLLAPMFEALQRSRGRLNIEVILVDNASRDDSVAIARRDHADARLLVNDVNVGFGRANNQALAHAKGRYVLLLNTDAFVAADTLTRTVEYMDGHSACGVLGVRLVGRDGAMQPGCRYFPTPWNTFVARNGLGRWLPVRRPVDDLGWDQRGVRECDWVPGCYYLVRREVIERVGLFDPRYFLYSEEVDHCRAVKKAGWRVMFFGSTEVVHLGGESAKSDGDLTRSGRQLSALQIESELLYFRKHHGAVGVASALLLNVVSVLTELGKRALGRGTAEGARGAVARVSAAWQICRLTGGGLRATR